MHLEELADDSVGIETDGVRVGAYVGTAKDPGGPLRHVVALESFEHRRLDLRPRGDLGERDASLFTVLAHAGAEGIWHCYRC